MTYPRGVLAEVPPPSTGGSPPRAAIAGQKKGFTAGNTDIKSSAVTKKKKTIPIRCQYSRLFQPAELSWFQGELKRITKNDLQKIKTSIIKNGFVFPVYVWLDGDKNYIIGGHHRLKAINELEQEGYAIDGIPAVIVNASSYEEAKKFVLLDSSHYAKIDKKEFGFFAEESGIDITEILNEVASKEIELADIYKKTLPVPYDLLPSATASKVPVKIVAFTLTQEEFDLLKKNFIGEILSDEVKKYILKSLSEKDIKKNKNVS